MTRNWDIKRIYFYLVCLVTLIMVIVGTVQLFQGIVDFVYPEPPYNVYETKFEHDPKMTEAEKKAESEKLQQLEVQRQKHWQVKRLVNSFALIIVALPIYLYHWRKVQNFEV